jgi:hypothetical protein
MGLFEKMFKRNDQQQGVVPLPEQFMSDMQPGIGGPQYVNPPFPDSTQMANQPIFQNFREQEQMVGLANVTLDNNENVEEFASKLRGYRIAYDINVQTGMPEKKITRFGRPFCNDDGVNELVGDLRVYLSKGWMLSNIPKADRHMINNMCHVIAIEIEEKMAMNVENWALDRTRMSTVSSLFVFTIWGNVMRSFEDGERSKLYPTQKNINMNSTMGQMVQPKKSVLEI